MPLYKYSFSAFSNNISTQAQYEMLKYLSFPLQVPRERIAFSHDLSSSHFC